MRIKKAEINRVDKKAKPYKKFSLRDSLSI